MLLLWLFFVQLLIFSDKNFKFVRVVLAVLYGELGLPNFTDSPSKIILRNLQELLENLSFL